MKLESMHKLHFIHGDIKPQNTAYSNRHGCILIDFGLSRILR